MVIIVKLLKLFIILYNSMLIYFEELGKIIMFACLTKTSFLVSFCSMACPLALSCRAAVF